MDSRAWPELEYAAWRDTCTTLHRWLQVAGKVRLALAPHRNQYWEATFYVTPRGLTSSAIPLPGAEGIFSIDFDFLADELVVCTSAGAKAGLALRPQTVAEFEREFLGLLAGMGIAVKIWPVPVEMADTLRLDEDNEHRSYDAGAVRHWWRVLVAVERVFDEFSSGFQGKASPVHLFWGSLDLAQTRFSGRRAPERPEADRVTRESYSQEVASVGFWPGDARYPEAAFYAYAAPAPAGYAQARLQPEAAFHHAGLGEFLLRYDDVRRAPDPRAALLAFCQSSYAAAAQLGQWDRKALELPGVAPAA